MLAEKIAENIEKHKDKIALWDKDKAISYGKLGDVINLNLDRINTVGNVGILTSHSSEGIIAELICLFLNKTFIPIVDNLPTFRIEKMIEISNITGIIIATEDKRVVQDLKEKYPKLDFFSIRKNGSVKKNVFISKVYNEVPNDMYHLYTSGSTGIPKAVVQTKKSVYHFATQYIERLDINSEDRLTLFSSLGHDASIIDIYSSLLSGASLFVCDIRNILMLRKLEIWLPQHEITVWHSVPTLLRSFFRFCKKDVKSLRLCVLGGEAVLESDFVKVSSMFSGARLYSLYGQTEHSYTSGIFINSVNDVGILGEPIDGVDFEMIPMTEKEFMVRINSPYILKSYLNSNDKPVCQGNIFDTGDVAINNSEGKYKFLGRRDTQIKIRGYRVDLHEIEAIVSGFYTDIDLWIISLSVGENTFLIGVYKGVDVDIQSVNSLILSVLPEYCSLNKLIKLNEDFPLTVTGKRNLGVLKSIILEKYIN